MLVRSTLWKKSETHERRIRSQGLQNCRFLIFGQFLLLGVPVPLEPILDNFHEFYSVLFLRRWNSRWQHFHVNETCHRIRTRLFQGLIMYSENVRQWLTITENTFNFWFLKSACINSRYNLSTLISLSLLRKFTCRPRQRPPTWLRCRSALSHELRRVWW